MSVRASVVVPVFNASKTVRESLASLQAQTLRDLEILCVDDGSSDDSAAVVEAIAAEDPRISLIRLGRNCGTHVARKTGVARSTGEYLLFLDPDDAYLPDACEVLCAEMDRGGHDILRFDFDVHAQGELPAERRDWFARNRCRGDVRVGNRAILSTFFSGRGGMLTLLDRIYRGDVCRRAFARTEDVHLTYAEDLYECFAVAAHAHRYGEIRRPLYRYNLSAGITSWQNQSGATLAKTVDVFFAGLVKRARSYAALKRLATAFGAEGDPDFYRDLVERERAHLLVGVILGECKRFLLQTGQVPGRHFGESLGAVFDVLDAEDAGFLRTVTLAQWAGADLRQSAQARRRVVRMATLVASPFLWFGNLAGIGRRQGLRAMLLSALFKPWNPAVVEEPWNAAVFQYARFRQGRLEVEGFVAPVSLSPARTLEFRIIGSNGIAVLSETLALVEIRHDGAVRRGYRFRFEFGSRFPPDAYRCQAVAEGVAFPLVMHLGPNFPIPRGYRHAAFTMPDGLQLRCLADGRFAVARHAAASRFKQELRFCLELLRGRTSEEWTAVALRMAVRVWRRCSTRRHWIFSDKLDNPFDSAYATAHALVSMPDPGPGRPRAHYLVARDRPVARQLAPGIEPVRHLSLRHAFLHLAAEANITSEDGYSPFGKATDLYRDLLGRQVRVWSGHGIIHHDLTALYGKDRQNFSLMTAGAARERDDVLGGTWGYDEDEVALTGLSRWDFRESEPARKIFFIFTWRADLVAGADPRTRERIYDERFADSEFRRRLEALLSDRSLLDAAKAGGYSLHFVPHPLVRPALRFFTFPSEVRVETEDTPYESIYREASLLVTDYSSVAMDMAYLGKPVVYYQFDREAFYAHQGYTPSFYHWEEDGFGEVCKDHGDVVGSVIRLLEGGCSRPPRYEARARAFFPARDKRNGVRTCEAVLAKLKQWGFDAHA